MGTEVAAAEALDTVCELGSGRVPDRLVDEARELRRKVDERLARGDRLTVAAIAGGTGVGKSTLLNAIVGRSVAREGVRRPTTQVPLGVYSDHSDALGSLLDWLEVPERQAVGDALPDDLVLVDLPDHDSVVDSHRTTATRFARRVDVVVWVFDPIKYTRADAYAGPLAELTAHAEVLLVVLNRIDELSEDELRTCRADLESHLADEGHRDIEVFPTSATTGRGVEELRNALIGIAHRREAAARRLSADVQQLAARISDHLDPIPDLDVREGELVDAVMDATYGHQRVEEAAIAYRVRAGEACRSPLARVARSPIGLARAAAIRLGLPLEEAGEAVRRSTPSRVHGALTHALAVPDSVGRVYAAIERTIETVAQRTAPTLIAAVDRAGADPGDRRWWSLAAAARGVAEATAVAGLLWLLIIGAVDWLQLPELPVPMVNDDLSWPAALFVGGLAVRVLLGLLNRAMISAGARRCRRNARRAIATQLGEIVDEQLLGPVRAEIDTQRRLHSAVAGAAGTNRTS